MSEERGKWEALKQLVPVATLVPNINLDGLVRVEYATTFEGVPTFPVDSNRNFRWRVRRDSGVYNGDCPIELANSFATRVYVDRDNRKISEALSGFEGQTVIDLGAGRIPVGYLIADFAKARNYVGVEPNFMQGLLSQMEILPSSSEVFREDFASGTYNKTPFALVEEDMLSFLKRLQDSSVSLFCAGIDQYVIRNEMYTEEVALEIVRVLHPQGVYVGEAYGGHIWLDYDTPGIQNTSMTVEAEYGLKTHLRIYQKNR